MTPKKQPDVRDADQVIRDYYEGGTEEDAFREDGTEPISSESGSQRSETGRSPVLSGGDVDAANDQGEVGTETVGGSNPTPDQDIVEELGKAVGINYEDTEPLKFGEKVADRDQRRWELDPASSEDYKARVQEASAPQAPAAPPKDAGQAKSKPTGAAGSRKGRARRSKRS